MFTKLNVVIDRLARQLASKEIACQKTQHEADALQESIVAARLQHTQIQQHLMTLMLSGATSLASLLEFKGRQATLQRKLAEIDVQLADKQLRHDQLLRQLSELRIACSQLHKKRDKMTEHQCRWRRQQLQGWQRRQETENEEQHQWQR